MTPTGRSRAAVLWHDLECGGYAEDLPLWRELAGAGGRRRVLDVGAGTGRVTLDLARRGIEVVALDADAAPAGRAARSARPGCPSRTVAADARDFDARASASRWCIVPMQTVQLLGGPAGRAAFLACARRHLQAGRPSWPSRSPTRSSASTRSTTSRRCPTSPRSTAPSTPAGLWPSATRATASRSSASARRSTPAAGARPRATSCAWTASTPATLEAEARAAGLRVLPRRRVPQTEEYIGSEVVVLGA